MRDNEQVTFTARNEVVVEDCPLPEPESEQVLVETERTLISTGTETTVLSDEYPEGSVWDEMVGDFPHGAGYSNVGTIVEIGEDVDESWLGRRVATRSHHRRFVTAHVDGCLEVPDGVSAEEATFFALGRTVMNGVRRGNVTWGHVVGVFGLGLLGQLTVQFCNAAGARPILAFELDDERFDYLPDDSTVVPVDPTDPDYLDAVEDATGGRLADVVVEATGNPDAIPSEFEVLEEQGRLVILSSPKGPTELDFHVVNRYSYDVVGAHIYHQPTVERPENPWTAERHGDLFFDLLADGELDTGRLVSHREAYERAPEAYELLLERRKEAMGVVLEW